MLLRLRGLELISVSAHVFGRHAHHSVRPAKTCGRHAASVSCEVTVTTNLLQSELAQNIPCQTLTRKDKCVACSTKPARDAKQQQHPAAPGLEAWVQMQHVNGYTGKLVAAHDTAMCAMYRALPRLQPLREHESAHSQACTEQ